MSCRHLPYLAGYYCYSTLFLACLQALQYLPFSSESQFPMPDPYYRTIHIEIDELLTPTKMEVLRMLLIMLYNISDRW